MARDRSSVVLKSFTFSVFWHTKAYSAIIFYLGAMANPDAVPLEDGMPSFDQQNPTAPLKCANWYTDAKGKCVPVTKTVPMADVLQFFIDWITIIGCAFWIIYFLNRWIGFYNRRCENVDKISLLRNYRCYACAALTVGCAAGFMSKMVSFMNLKPTTFMLVFNALWSQSYVIVWLAIGLIQLHYIEVWVVRFKDLNLNVGRFRYSWIIIGATLLLGALAVTYDLYINIVTDLYKSQNAYYVRVGWILMSLPYMLLCALSLLMFPVVHRLRYTRGGAFGEMLNVFNMVVLIASAFSVIVIYYFEFFPANLSLFLTVPQALLNNGTLRSYIIRLLVLLCNYIMLGACAYVLSFGSYVQMPLIGEVYYLARPMLRSKVYAEERLLRAERGYVDWSASSSNKDPHHSLESPHTPRRASTNTSLALSSLPPSKPSENGTRRHDFSRMPKVLNYAMVSQASRAPLNKQEESSSSSSSSSTPGTTNIPSDDNV